MPEKSCRIGADLLGSHHGAYATHLRIPIWSATAALLSVLAFPIGTVTVLQFVKEIICVTFMVFAIVASVKNLGLGL